MGLCKVTNELLYMNEQYIHVHEQWYKYEQIQGFDDRTE